MEQKTGFFIDNVSVSREVHAKAMVVGGLLGCSEGKATTISNCKSSVNIHVDNEYFSETMVGNREKSYKPIISN